MRCRELDIFKILGIFWEFFGNSLGILWEFLHFQSQLIVYILKSADFLYSKSQLITKKYFNMEGIDLFVKILVFCQDFGVMHIAQDKKFRPLKMPEASSSHLKILVRNLLIYIYLHCVSSVS